MKSPGKMKSIDPVRQAAWHHFYLSAFFCVVLCCDPVDLTAAPALIPLGEYSHASDAIPLLVNS